MSVPLNDARAYQTGRPLDVFKPRPSRKDNCSHDFDYMRPTRNQDYWFKMCRDCREVMWG